MPKPTEKPIVDMRSLSLRAGKALGRNGGHEGRSHMTFALRGRGGWLTGKMIALIGCVIETVTSNKSKTFVDVIFERPHA